MKTYPRIQQADPVDTTSAEAGAKLQALAAQRMSEFLDALPQESTDPSAPLLSLHEINAVVHELRA